MTTIDTATIFPAPEMSHDLDATDLERAWRTRDELIKRLHEAAEEFRGIYRQELDALQDHTNRRREIEHGKSTAD